MNTDDHILKRFSSKEVDDKQKQNNNLIG